MDQYCLSVVFRKPDFIIIFQKRQIDQPPSCDTRKHIIASRAY